MRHYTETRGHDSVKQDKAEAVKLLRVQFNSSECGLSPAPQAPPLADYLLLDLLFLDELVVGTVQLPLQAAVPVVGGLPGGGRSPALAQQALTTNRNTGLTQGRRQPSNQQRRRQQV